jgi:hypothetical protein
MEYLDEGGSLDPEAVMMSDFLAQHRDELIGRCISKVAKRPFRLATTSQLRNGIPLFLAQLQRTLEAEHRDEAVESLKISGESGGGASTDSEMGIGASEHGRQLSALGYTVDQVVHDYGDLCQALTEMASEQGAPIAVTEFQTLNRCLDNAIAVAVLAFSSQRDLSKAARADADAEMRQSSVLHQLRSSLATAHYAAAALELGNLPMSGATGHILKRSLAAMRTQLGETGAPPAQEG